MLVAETARASYEDQDSGKDAVAACDVSQTLGQDGGVSAAMVFRPGEHCDAPALSSGALPTCRASAPPEGSGWQGRRFRHVVQVSKGEVPCILAPEPMSLSHAGHASLPARGTIKALGPTEQWADCAPWCSKPSWSRKAARVPGMERESQQPRLSADHMIGHSLWMLSEANPHTVGAQEAS